MRRGRTAAAEVRARLAGTAAGAARALARASTANLHGAAVLRTCSSVSSAPRRSRSSACWRAGRSWGAVPELFDEQRDGVGAGSRAAARAARRRAATRRRGARRSTRTTPTRAIAARDLADRCTDLGFNAGRVLEPGCGAACSSALAPERRAADRCRARLRRTAAIARRAVSARDDPRRVVRRTRGCLTATSTWRSGTSRSPTCACTTRATTAASTASTTTSSSRRWR